ncbi:hypothetical protein IW254_000050 [Corynebacterium aquatimens]|uniref:Uncharacterized protein n=1 Tax=Corynebacterium aquatimens TaxID=1190508 RepID=A0A931GVC5_9CORY|nr:hypothetical protein [Corynebacterium aquatimens]
MALPTHRSECSSSPSASAKEPEPPEGLSFDD